MIPSIVNENVFDLRILSIDIALANTGWCVLEFSTKGSVFKIKNCNTIVTEINDDRPSRVRKILYEVTQLIAEHNINCVIIEEPPDSVFGGGNANMIKGRAVSVFSVVAACYAIVGFCFANGIFCREIFPKQWQKNGKINSKTWSLQEARKAFDYLKFKRRLLQKDHHIADAVCIGITAINNFTYRRWVIPNVDKE